MSAVASNAIKTTLTLLHGSKRMVAILMLSIIVIQAMLLGLGLLQGAEKGIQELISSNLSAMLFDAPDLFLTHKGEGISSFVVGFIVWAWIFMVFITIDDELD